MKMFRWILPLLLALATTAGAQTSVRQSGNITPGHVAMWTTTGVIQDGGSAANGFLTSIGVVNNGGPGICLQTAPIASPFNRLCLQATTSGNAQISYNAFNGATAGGITFQINGVTSGFPAVNLPVTVDYEACFADTGGTLKQCAGSRVANILNFGAIANDNTKGAINAAAFVAAFAASPAVYCPDGQTFYTNDVVIPTTATRLFGKCTLIAVASMTTALVRSASNIAGLVIEDINVSVNTTTFPTIYGILLNGNTGTTIQNTTLTGLHPVLLSTSTKIFVQNNQVTISNGNGIYSNTGSSYLFIQGNEVNGAGAGSGLHGIFLSSATNSQIVGNTVKTTTGFGIAASLGNDVLIANNQTLNTVLEGVHVDSINRASIVGNILQFSGTSTDVGISVSNDNVTIATNVLVSGNNINSPNGPGIYLIGAQRSSVVGNFIRNANVGAGLLNASIVLDGSNTTFNTVGQNTISDTLGNNGYQVAEVNFTGSGSPANNFIAQQIGTAGTTGFISQVATTDTSVRANNSPSSTDAVTGFRFGSSGFALRDIATSNVYLKNFNDSTVVALGSTASNVISFGATTHQWSSAGYGALFALLDNSGWSWLNTASGSTPSAGSSRVYVDIATKALTSKDDAGILHTTVVADTGAANNFLTAISAAGVISKARPSCANLSDAGSGCSAAAGITALTGDLTAAGPGSVAGTLATVNANVGTFGSATQSGQFTVNGKGLITAAANVTITPAVGSITGFGTGVATFLATPSSANLLAAVTDETGTGALVFGTSPTITTPSILGATTFNSTIVFNGQANVGTGPGFSHSTSNTFLLAGGTSGYTFNNAAGDTNLLTISDGGNFAALINIASTSKTTGSITSAGGLGVAGAIFTDTLSVITMANDTAQTDNTVCVNSAGLTLKGTGALGICLGTSGRQFKTDLSPMQAGLTELMQISFWNYRYRPGYGDGGGRLQYGAIAQEVEIALPDLAGHNADGETINYDWGGLLFVGLRSIQQLKADNDNLWIEIQRLKEARR